MLNAVETTDLASAIRADVLSNNIQLPTLPEVALRVREAVESDDATAASIAAILANDAALSARLLQVANSPLYRGRVEIDSIDQAVTRLGLRMVRSLVVSLAMKQIFQATSYALDKQFRRVWDDALQVAAISRVLATTVPELENEQAMLGGLIHNIGALPILTRIDAYTEGELSEAEIERVIAQIGPEVGALIMQHWHFAASLANIPTAAFDLSYDPGPVPTYGDLVLVARLQHEALRSPGAPTADWSQVPAFAKLGLDSELETIEVVAPAEEVAEVRTMLEG